MLILLYATAMEILECTGLIIAGLLLFYIILRLNKGGGDGGDITDIFD